MMGMMGAMGGAPSYTQYLNNALGFQQPQMDEGGVAAQAAARQGLDQLRAAHQGEPQIGPYGAMVGGGGGGGYPQAGGFGAAMSGPPQGNFGGFGMGGGSPQGGGMNMGGFGAFAGGYPASKGFTGQGGMGGFGMGGGAGGFGAAMQQGSPYQPNYAQTPGQMGYSPGASAAILNLLGQMYGGQQQNGNYLNMNQYNPGAWAGSPMMAY